MEDHGPRRLELEVRFEPEPIHGRIYYREAAEPAPRTFSGWLGLIEAIDAARGNGSSADMDDGNRR